MENKCTEIEIVDTVNIIPNPKNRNQHPESQIEMLCKIIKHQGFREPLIISKRSGFLVAGHGRLEAAKKLGIEKLPVIRQDFASEALEYQHMIADNEIARWANLDVSGLRDDLKDFDLDDFEIDMLGIDGFKVDDLSIENIEGQLPDIGDGSDPDCQQMTFILSNEQSDVVREAIKKAGEENDCSDEINQNSNGNKLAMVCKMYAQS